MILEAKQQFQKRRKGPLGGIVIQVDSEEEGRRSRSDEGSNIISSPLCSVGLIDSIAANADFIALDS
jgi:hypothetical protein